MDPKKYKSLIVKEGTPFEWALTVPYTILIILIAGLGVAVDVLEYSARYYGGPSISYVPSYKYLMIGVMFLYFVYFYSYLYIKGKILKKTITMTIDMLLAAAVFFAAQLTIFHFMNVKLGP